MDFTDVFFDTLDEEFHSELFMENDEDTGFADLGAALFFRVNLPPSEYSRGMYEILNQIQVDRAPMPGFCT